MSMISTVRLPVVKPTDTIETAIDRIKAGDTSGVVVAMDDAAPLVISDWFLKNSLIANGENHLVTMSDVARAAFPFSPPPSSGSRFFGRFLRSAPTAAAPIQRDYRVTDWDMDGATVSTDPARAAELSRPSALFKSAFKSTA